MTKQEFINSEMHKWGEDHIFDLFERGYDILPYNGGWRWVRILNQVSPTTPTNTPLTQGLGCATVGKRG